MLRLVAPCLFDLGIQGGLGAKRRNQIFPDVNAHSRLDKCQDRRRQQKDDRNHGYEKLGPEMSKKSLRHVLKA